VNTNLTDALRRAAERGGPGDPDRVLAQARQNLRRRRYATRAAAVVATGVAGVSLAFLLGAGPGVRSDERVVTSDPDQPQHRPPNVASTGLVLSEGANVWPRDDSTTDRSSPTVVASTFITLVTGEAPAEVTLRPNDAPGPGPTYVDVKLNSGAVIDVFVAPEGERGWRIIQVGQPSAASPSGGVPADVAAGPVEVGKASPIKLRFEPPADAAAGIVFYSTPGGTFEAKLGDTELRSREVVLSNSHVTANGLRPESGAGPSPMDLGAVAIVFRSPSGAVVGVRAVHFGTRPG
jgi:hypothetical protein